MNVYVQKERVTANAEGFIDAIRYVIRLYDLHKTNIAAYKWLIMDGIVDYMKNASLPEGYMRKIISEIEQDHVFPQKTIQEICRTVKLTI